MQTTPYDSPGAPVFLCQKSRRNSTGSRATGAPNRGGIGSDRRFSLYLNNKLSDRRGTAKRHLLVNSCYVSRGMGARRISNSKCTFKVIHSIGHIRFPIRLPLQWRLYLAPFSRYYHLFPTLSPTSQNLRRSCDPKHIPIGGSLSFVH